MTAKLVTPSFTSNIHKFTVQQYHLMHEAGIFAESDRLELINGEIREMSPIGRKHVSCIIRLVRLMQTKLGDRVMVSVQNSILLDDNSQPQPDLAILKPRDDFYEERLPIPSDILLIIEVADSSIDYDREVKAPMYAMAGIPEMWLFDVNKKAIAVYSLPSPSGYKQVRHYQANDSLIMMAFPDVVFNWEELF